MTAARLITFLDDLAQEFAARPSAQPFEPRHTSIHVGVVNGGTAPNIISRECRFRWDVRCIPGDPQEILDDSMKVRTCCRRCARLRLKPILKRS